MKLIDLLGRVVLAYLAISALSYVYHRFDKPDAQCPVAAKGKWT